MQRAPSFAVDLNSSGQHRSRLIYTIRLPTTKANHPTQPPNPAPGSRSWYVLDRSGSCVAWTGSIPPPDVSNTPARLRRIDHRARSIAGARCRAASTHPRYRTTRSRRTMPGAHLAPPIRPAGRPQGVRRRPCAVTRSRAGGLCDAAFLQPEGGAGLPVALYPPCRHRRGQAGNPLRRRPTITASGGPSPKSSSPGLTRGSIAAPCWYRSPGQARG